MFLALYYQNLQKKHDYSFYLINKDKKINKINSILQFDKI